MKLSIRCYEPTQAHKALTSEIWPSLKAELMAGNKMILEIRPEKRNIQQNALLHALIAQLSLRKEWDGEKRSIEVWKQIMVAGWMIATNRKALCLSSPENNDTIFIYQRTSTLSKPDFAELIEYIYSWAAQNGIELQKMDDYETLYRI